MQVYTKIRLIPKKVFYTIAPIAFSVVPDAIQKLRLQRNEIPKIKLCKSMFMLVVHVYRQENLKNANFRTQTSTEKNYTIRNKSGLQNPWNCTSLGLSLGGGLRGLQPPQFLTDQLTLYQPGGGQIMHTTVLPAPPDFQTLRRACSYTLFSTSK